MFVASRNLGQSTDPLTNPMCVAARQYWMRGQTTGVWNQAEYDRLAGNCYAEVYGQAAVASGASAVTGATAAASTGVAPAGTTPATVPWYNTDNLYWVIGGVAAAGLALFIFKK